EKTDAVAAQDAGGEVAHDDLVAIALGDMGELGHHLPALVAGIHRQADVAETVAACGARIAQRLEPAYAALVAGAAGFHALADPLLFLGQELVEARGGFFFGFQFFGLAPQVVGETPRVARQPAAVELDDAGGDVVQEDAG